MRFLKVFIASITILSLLLGCCSCSVEYPEETTIVNGEVQMDPPSRRLLKRIERDYKKMDGSKTECWVSEYYGCYNGAIPVKFSGTYDSYVLVEHYYEVAGYTLDGSGGNMIYVWKDGKIVTLPETYEQGLLTKEDIDMMFSGKAIHYSYSSK